MCDVPEERIPYRNIIVTTPCACVRVQNAVQNVSISGYGVRQQTHGTSQWRRWYFWFALQETSFKSLYRDLVSCLLCVLVTLTFSKRVCGWNFNIKWMHVTAAILHIITKWLFTKERIGRRCMKTTDPSDAFSAQTQYCCQHLHCREPNFPSSKTVCRDTKRHWIQPPLWKFCVFWLFQLE